jgi:hypothetical protein
VEKDRREKKRRDAQQAREAKMIPLSATVVEVIAEMAKTSDVRRKVELRERGGGGHSVKQIGADMTSRHAAETSRKSTGLRENKDETRGDASKRRERMRECKTRGKREDQIKKKVEVGRRRFERERENKVCRKCQRRAMEKMRWEGGVVRFGVWGLVWVVEVAKVRREGRDEGRGAWGEGTRDGSWWKVRSTRSTEYSVP